MKDKAINTIKDPGITLVIGGTGKTGRRVAERLEARGVETRIASRSADPSFDWNDTAGWDAALDGVTAAYITYAPDLAIPGATESIRAFVDRAVARGVKRLVLLSGRGERSTYPLRAVPPEAPLACSATSAFWACSSTSCAGWATSSYLDRCSENGG